MERSECGLLAFILANARFREGSMRLGFTLMSRVTKSFFCWGMMVACGLIVGLPDETDMSAMAQIRTTTSGVIPLDELVQARVRGVQLRVPGGYLEAWPTQATRGRNNEQQSLSFTFWMPDRRYVEIPTISIVGFRPRESGRTEPRPEQYVVRVKLLKPIRVGEAGYVSPEKRFQNATSDGIEKYAFADEVFGLVRFWQHDWPHPQPEAFTKYRHQQGTDPQILLRCTPEHEKLPYPICFGDVHFDEDNLGFYIQFPRDQIARWRQIVFATRDLFMSWKITP